MLTHLTTVLVLTFPCVVAALAAAPRAGASKSEDILCSAAQPDQGDAGKEKTDAFGDPLPTGAIARMGSMRLRHSGPVHMLAYTPSGKLASSGADGTVRLWDGVSGKELLRLDAGESWVQGLAVSRDEKLLVAGGDAVYVWEIGTGKRLHRLQGKAGTYSVAFSPDGKRVAAADGDGVFRLWDVASGKVVQTFSSDQTFIPKVAFSPDGTVLATGHASGTVWLWDPASGKALRQLRHHQSNVYALAFSADGRLLASGSEDRTLCLWDMATGQLSRELKGNTHQVLSVAFSPDGKKLASAAGDNLVRVWDVATGKELLHIRQGLGESDGNVNTVAWSPDGATLAAGSNHGRIRLWDAATGKEKQQPRGHEGQVIDLAFTPDGKQLISGCLHGTVIGWDAATGKELRTYSRDCHRVYSLSLAADGQTLAVGCEMAAHVWKTATGEEVLKVPNLAVRAALLPQGRLLTSGGFADSRLWDLKTGKLLHDDLPQRILTVGPGGRLLHQKEHSLFLQDAATRQDQVEFKLPVPQPPQLEQFKDKVLFNMVVTNCAALSPDSKLLATASQAYLTNKGEGPGAVYHAYEEAIHLWDVATGKLIRTIVLPVGDVTVRGRLNCLVFSPDGRTLAGGGRTVGKERIPPATVHFWDVDSGKEIHQIRIPRLLGEPASVCLAFAPDGKSLATGGCDTTVLIWQLPPAIAARAAKQLP
jgi:WD40 repeat protein